MTSWLGSLGFQVRLFPGLNPEKAYTSRLRRDEAFETALQQAQEAIKSSKCEEFEDQGHKTSETPGATHGSPHARSVLAPNIERYASPAPPTAGRTKRCKKCNEVKSLTDFGPHPSTRDGLQSFCKKCRDSYHKTRRDNDPAFRLKHHFASRIRTQLDPCPKDYFGELEALMDCDLKALAAQLNTQCLRDYGKTLLRCLHEGYHVDHITPLSHYGSTLDPNNPDDIRLFRECWHSSNLQMLSASDNLSKGTSVL